MWFLWGAALGLAIAIARLPLDTNLVPVLSAGVFSCLLLKELVRTEPSTALGASLAGLCLGGVIELLISPPCQASAVEIVIRQGQETFRCSEFQPMGPLVGAVSLGSFLILGILVWTGRRARAEFV